jgi:hypothetical protein
MADALIMEALARVEYKLDAIMRHQKIPMPSPMHFVGSACPACGMLIDYQVNLQHGVVVRKCECKTGKFPTKLEFLNPQSTSTTGVPNGRPDANPEDGSER